MYLRTYVRIGLVQRIPGAARAWCSACLVQRIPGAARAWCSALPTYWLLYWRECQDHRNVLGDRRDYSISQFSSVNIYNIKYTSSSLLERGLLDCHYIIQSNSSAPFTGASTEFIRPRPYNVDDDTSSID